MRSASLPSESLKLLVVGSRVAKSLSSARTLLSHNLFIRVDFPALVYPTSAMVGMAFLVRLSLKEFLLFSTSLSCASRKLILLFICLLSTSSFFSPGPLVPIPPPSLESWSQDPQASIPCILAGPVPLEVFPPGTRPFGKYVQNQSGPVHNLYSCHLFNIPHLDSRKLVVKNYQIGVKSLAYKRKFLNFSPSDKKCRVFCRSSLYYFFQNNRSGSAASSSSSSKDLSPSLFPPQ